MILNDNDKLLQDLKDHFPDCLYGMYIHFYDEKDLANGIAVGAAGITKDNTAFELCRQTIVKDVIKITDEHPEYKHYHFVLSEYTDNYIKCGRTVSLTMA